MNEPTNSDVADQRRLSLVAFELPMTSISPVSFLLCSILLSITLFTIPAGSMAASPEKLEAAAANGDVEAMFEVGSIALLAKDYPKALQWLSKGAAMNHGASEASLGFMYFNGYACVKDLARARELYEKSAIRNAHQGLNNLAHLYRYGLAGLAKDQAKSVELLEKAAALGNEYAVHTLAQLYMDDELGPPDTKKILHWLRWGAERNYRDCLSDLGYAYQHGIGVERDTQKAIEHYEKAIELGSAGAQSNLGFLYLKGEGVQQNYPMALKLFDESARANHTAGLINLAVMRYQGLGCERDPFAAFSLLEKAVNLGSEKAGQLLREWKTVETNQNK